MLVRLTQGALFACAALALAACSRDGEKVAAPASDPGGLAVQMWLDDFALGPPGSAAAPVTAGRHDFAPGEPVELSMSVEDAPSGATVTAYWYGPDDQPLGYETKSVTSGQDQLIFTHDNTHDWERGAYRAEIWVGDDKVTEQDFEITAG